MSDPPTGWLTADQFSACLTATDGQDISGDQQERWRGEGILPAVWQDPLKYHGSEIYYPPGYCEQAIAVRDLLLEKRKFDYVGWELWWRGFPVDDRHWRPRLRSAAKILDQGIKLLRLRIKSDEISDSKQTIFDRAARIKKSNIALSRLRGRLQRKHLPMVFRVLLTIATGEFEGFEPVTKTDMKLYNQFDDEISPRPDDENQTIKAFDFEQSEKDTILGQKLNLIGALGPTLRDISEAFRDQTLSEMLTASDAELFSARDDVRNAMRVGLELYDATWWIYGRKAFGLRFIAWIARKYDRVANATLIVGLIGLRKISSDLLPSSKIAELANQAEKQRDSSKKLEGLFLHDKRFSLVLSPKRLRRGFRDLISLRQLLREIEDARMN
jgi:hypothetical protein